MREPDPFSWPEDWEAALPWARARVRVLCRRYKLDAHETDDVIQRVSVKLWMATKTTSRHFVSVDKVAGWAWKVARSIVLEDHEKRSRRARILSVDLSEFPQSTGGETTPGALAEYLEMLPDLPQRDAVRL